MSLSRFIKKIRQNYYFWKMDYTPEIINSSEIKTVVIYHPDAVGDAMALYPVLRSLEKTNVKHIIIVASHRNAAVYENFTPSDIQVTLRTIPHRFDLNKHIIVQEAKWLRNTYGQPDLCIEATQQNKIDSALWVGTLKAKCNLTPNGACTMRCYSSMPRCAQQLRKEHQPAPMVWKQLMVDAGFPDTPSNFEFPIDARTEQEVASATTAQGISDYIVLNMDGSDAARKFSIEKGAELAKLLYDEFKKDIVIVYAPDGAEKAKQLASTFDHVHRLLLPPSLQRTVALVKGSSLVATPDTSILHMASAYNKPLIGIYAKCNQMYRSLSDKKAIIVTNSKVDDASYQQLATAAKELHYMIKTTERIEDCGENEAV